MDVCIYHHEVFGSGRSAANSYLDAPASKSQANYLGTCDEFIAFTAHQPIHQQPVTLPNGDVAIPIPGFPGYCVSENGIVVSLRKGKRILKPYKNEKGFLRVVVWLSGRDLHRGVHLLVWDAWQGARDGGRIIFLDGDRTNCCRANLKLVSRDQYELEQPRKFKTAPKLSDDDVRQIRACRGRRKQQDLADEFGVAESIISRIQTVRRRRAVMP